MAKILATDLDGTLFYPKQKKKCIPAKNIKFLQRWIDDGNKVVLCTSRSQQFVKRLEKEIERPFDLMTCNTAHIVADGKVIKDQSVPGDDLRKILNIIDKKYRPIAYLMTTKNYPCIIKNNRAIGKMLMFFYHLWYLKQGMYREPYVLSNKLFREELATGEIYKVMVFFGFGHNKKKFTKDLNKILFKEFPDLEFSWIGNVNEITPKGCNKGKGLEFYCQYQHIDPNDVYVIGDSGNDISMFNAFKDNSFVMSHASKVVKKYAKYEVNNVHGLEKFLLPKEKKTNESN